MLQERTDRLEQHVAQEIIEAGERGCNPAKVQEIVEHFEDLKKKAAPDRWRHYESILDILANLDVDEDCPYDEPSVLEDIRKASPKDPGLAASLISDDELEDRMHGAWLGRCAGCMLGKPVEGRPRDYIRELLEAADAYPLDDYFPQVAELPETCGDFNPPQTLLRGGITQLVRDDDIDYTVMNLHVLKAHGLGFTSADIAEEWLRSLPFSMLYTAERVAYTNFVNGILPPESASFRNPYREWIGAQIRADIWGYVNPGRPGQAAEFAFRDASVSHMANGIYGEMFFAAAISAAFVTGDTGDIINVGLSVVPGKSRFAEAVDDVLKWREEHDTWEKALEAAMEKLGHYHVVHTLNNAAIVLLALLYGEGDFGRTISLAVMGGEDTDCNGATVGSIMGAIVGAKDLPAKWSDCLNDRIESIVAGYTSSRISELVKQTFEIAQSNIR